MSLKTSHMGSNTKHQDLQIVRQQDNKSTSLPRIETNFRDLKHLSHPAGAVVNPTSRFNPEPQTIYQSSLKTETLLPHSQTQPLGPPPLVADMQML